MHETTGEFYARVVAAADSDGRLPLPMWEVMLPRMPAEAAEAALGTVAGALAKTSGTVHS